MNQPIESLLPEIAAQSIPDFAPDGQAMPSLNTGPYFDYTLNPWTNETFRFGTGIAPQSALGPVLNDQVTMPPSDVNPWMDQPVGLFGPQVASQSALFPLGQALAAFDSAPSYLQDVSFDINAADWTNHGAGMPYADPIR